MTHISISDLNKITKEPAKIELVTENRQLTTMMNDIKQQPRIKTMINLRRKESSTNLPDQDESPSIKRNLKKEESHDY